METDINEPKSRAFNLFLRCLQLAMHFGATLFVAYFVTRTCIDSNEFPIVSKLCLAFLGVSLVALLANCCSKQHPKCIFFIFLLVVIGVLAAIVFFVLRNRESTTNCAYNLFFYHFYLLSIALTILLGIVALLFPFYFAQRFTNSPGNLAWPVFFIAYYLEASGLIATLSLVIGILCTLVSLFSISCNLFMSCVGVTTSNRKCLMFFWGLDIVLILVAQGLSIWLYFTIRGDSQFNGFWGQALYALVCSFMLGNLIDLMWWIVGVKTLSLEQGDRIRD